MIFGWFWCAVIAVVIAAVIAFICDQYFYTDPGMPFWLAFLISFVTLGVQAGPLYKTPEEKAAIEAEEHAKMVARDAEDRRPKLYSKEGSCAIYTFKDVYRRDRYFTVCADAGKTVTDNSYVVKSIGAKGVIHRRNVDEEIEVIEVKDSK